MAAVWVDSPSSESIVWASVVKTWPCLRIYLGWNETLSIRSVGLWHRSDIGSPVTSVILGLLVFAVHHGTLSLEGNAVWTGLDSLLCTFCSVSVHGFPSSEPGEIWTLILCISFCLQLTARVCCSLVYIVCVPITPLCGRPFQFQILLPLMWVVLSCCPYELWDHLVLILFLFVRPLEEGVVMFLPSYWIPGLIFQGVLVGIQVLYTLVLVVLQYHPF